MLTSTPLRVSVVPALIEASVDILYNAERVPVVIVVQLIEPLVISISSNKSGVLILYYLLQYPDM